MSAKKKTSAKSRGEEKETKLEEENLQPDETGEEFSQEQMNDEASQGENVQPEAVDTETIEPEAAEEISLSPEEIVKLVKEKEEQYDRLLRTQADFDNYRKRVQKEQANLLRYGAENALREILPVVDNIERAVDSARTHDESNSQLREGIELIRSQFSDILSKLGVTPIETVGHAFDPNKHDALLRVHAPDMSEGAVVGEIRKGYYLHDKVLRPAQVTVGTHESIQDADQASDKTE